MDQGKEIRFILKVNSNPLQWLQSTILGKVCETELECRGENTGIS